MNKLSAALMLAALSSRAETIISNTGATNRIDLKAGDVALIQCAKLSPRYTTEHQLLWRSGDGDQANIGTQSTTSVANPVIIAGPGSLSVCNRAIITYQKIKATNVVTAVVGETPVRVRIEDGKRAVLMSYPARADTRPRVEFTLMEHGGELTTGAKAAVTRSLDSSPLVLDGPFDLFMWATSEPATVTVVMKDQTVEAPAYTERGIQIQTSDDGVNWAVSSIILPGADDKKFIRLK